MWTRVCTPHTGAASPSATLRAEGRRSTVPEARLRDTTSAVAGSTPTTWTSGSSVLRTTAMPEMSPPPPTGTRTMSSSGRSASSSRARLPCPAMTSGSSNGWTGVRPRSSRTASYVANRSPSARITSPPYARVASILAGTAVAGITTVADVPACRAAQASAAAALPADTVTTPRARCCGVRRSSLCSMPRTLKLPVCWNISALNSSRSPTIADSDADATTGVTLTLPRMRCAACRTASMVTRSPTASPAMSSEPSPAGATPGPGRLSSAQVDDLDVGCEVGDCPGEALLVQAPPGDRAAVGDDVLRHVAGRDRGVELPPGGVTGRARQRGRSRHPVHTDVAHRGPVDRHAPQDDAPHVGPGYERDVLRRPWRRGPERHTGGVHAERHPPVGPHHDPVDDDQDEEPGRERGDRELLRVGGLEQAGDRQGGQEGAHQQEEELESGDPVTRLVQIVGCLGHGRIVP